MDIENPCKCDSCGGDFCHPESGLAGVGCDQKEHKICDRCFFEHYTNINGWPTKEELDGTDDVVS